MNLRTGIKVFVYGTLKRGYGLNSVLDGAAFCGEATVPDHTLYAVSSFPGAVPEEGAFIRGEVYEVDEATLERLDQAEGVPRMYRRERVVTDDGEPVWIYIWNGPVYEGWGRLGPDWPGFSEEAYEAIRRFAREGFAFARSRRSLDSLVADD